jgi:hypothetical protein
MPRNTCASSLFHLRQQRKGGPVIEPCPRCLRCCCHQNQPKMANHRWFELVYQAMLSDRTKERSERVILSIAIFSFLAHLAIIFLVDFGLISLEETPSLLKSPIAAIYTPFSFILIYEVYLLVYYLPKSTTTYISKQYEIITLVVIRRLFKDFSGLTLSSDWFQFKGDLQFTYDLISSVLLFYLIYLFYLLGKKNNQDIEREEALPSKVVRFINFKKIIALCLVPLLLIIALYSFASWAIGVFKTGEDAGISFKNINNVFFEGFFTVLIIVDVILLLLSYYYTDTFHKVIRNSGFVISTILIRLSFSVDGLVSSLLILSAIVFGLLILAIHNQFEKHIVEQE